MVIQWSPLRPYPRKLLTMRARQRMRDCAEATAAPELVRAAYLRARDEARKRGGSMVNASDVRNALGLPHPPSKDD
ncbi:MAG: hypothetical protein ACYC2H_06495 [Thermoplasmatota archaeon]